MMGEGESVSVKITGVDARSIAAFAGIKKGEVLLCINAHEIEDGLDYRFYIGEQKLTLTLRGTDGTERRLHLFKKENEDIGLEFETYLMDKQQSCKNKCIFCFVDQMPPGMRESLYFKDDDSRLSFLFGNYITLTGLSEREVRRIIELHLSPINISVHTMNPSLRVQMMKNPRAGECLSLLGRFAEAGIAMNTQLVLCPGINDGEELRRSLRELSELYPAVQSIAAVPVGLTKYREGLPPLTPYERETAEAVIDEVERFGNEFYEKHGTRLAFAADEFYLKAQRDLPPVEAYEDFLQLDNGVGLWRLTEDEFIKALEEKEAFRVERDVSLVTGEAAYPLIRQLCERAEKKFTGLQTHVYEIKNDFFGHSVTVAGLLTGGDILRQLQGKPLGEELIVPQVMLRHGENVFLDDVSVKQLSEKLNIRVVIQPAGAQGLLDALVGEVAKDKEWLI